MSYPTFSMLLGASTLIDALAVALVLLGPYWLGWRQNSTDVRLSRIVNALLVAILVFLVKLAPLTLIGFNLFGVIHLIYLDMIIIPPMASLALFLTWRLGGRKRDRLVVTRPAWILATAALTLIPIGVYASLVEPFRLRLETALVPISPARLGSDSMTVGVIADLQTTRITSYERSAFDRLMALRPDLILIPGDLFQGSEAELDANRPALVELLKRLSAPGGVYFVLGDVDQGHYVLEEVIREAGITMLVNEVTHVRIGDRRVTVGGIELDAGTGRAGELLQDLETEPGSEDVRILVAHRPDVALHLKRKSRVDVVVAGHTHGGQIVVPGFGPPMTLSDVPRQVAAGGLHELEENQLYVSRGVGCERGQAPRIRFLCPPEISLLELTSTRSK